MVNCVGFRFATQQINLVFLKRYVCRMWLNASFFVRVGLSSCASFFFVDFTHKAFAGILDQPKVLQRATEPA